MRVLVTGAGRGIGHALLVRYADQPETDAFGTVRGAAQTPPGATLLPLDVARPDDFAPLAACFQGGALDLLVCNAGVYPDKALGLDTGIPAAMWAAAFAVNVTGVWLTVEALLPALRRAQAPRIAIISSIMGSSSRAPGGAYVYRASKAAVTNLGRNLAADLAPQGVAVGIYHPGWVRTDMGGADADIDAGAAADGLLARFTALDLANSGVVEAWNGTPVPF